MKACFATKGFNGKIDCDEWAKDTNYKSLPKKKEDGGYNMYRPKNCKKCGSKKMQIGGLQSYTASNTPQGAVTPTGQSSLASNSPLTLEQIRAMASDFGFRTDSNVNLQSDLFKYAQENQPAAYTSVMDRFGQTNAGTFNDGILGARTGELMSMLRKQQQPQQQSQMQQADLSEWMYGPDKHAIGSASRPYRASFGANDSGILDQNPNSPQYIDFMYNKPDSQEVDESRGRHRIPYEVWSNMVTRGTQTVQDPSVIDQYKVGSVANLPIRMKGGRLKRMQVGGMPRQEDYPDYETFAQALDAWTQSNNSQQQLVQSNDLRDLMGNFNDPLQDVTFPAPEVAPQQTPLNRVQEGIQAGIIEAPKDFSGSAQQWYDSSNWMRQKQPKKKSNTLQNVGIGIRAARTGLGWLSGIVERGRQNQYDMTQQTALGQMNPMQVSDFQPNPYNLYMKQGGKLKTILDDYNKWSNDAGPMDMTHGTGNPNMKKGGYEIDRMIIVRKLLPELLNFGRLGSNYRKYRGAQNGGTLTPYSPEFLNSAYKDYQDFYTNTPVPQARHSDDGWDDYQMHLRQNVTKPMQGEELAWIQTKLDKDGNPMDIYNTYSEKPEDRKGWNTEQKMKNFTKRNPEESRFMEYFRGRGLAKRMNPEDKNSPFVAPYHPMKKGGIHIKEENRGKFTEYCGGQVTDECIKRALTSKSKKLRARANFARNARKWNK